MLTAKRLRELLDYDPETGVFRWKYRRDRKQDWNTRYAGTIAGCLNGAGYLQIVFDSKIYLAHRLAFLYMIGRWPEADTDHVNLNRSDCRWSNLREATRAQNLQNKGRIKTNTSGFPGVHFYKRTNNWAVKIEVNGKKIQIYGFDTIEAAVQARSELVKKYHGEFARLS